VTTTDGKPTEIPLGDSGGGPFKGHVGGLLINLILVVAIVLSLVWLPPISLHKRLAEGGYAPLGQGAWSVTDPDGTQFTVLPEGLHGQLKAKLSSVPRADFLSGSAGNDLAAAAESVPSYLDIKSPLYRLSLRGERPTSSILTVPIPNDSQPYETLGMYAWTENGWAWMPSQIIGAEDIILAELDAIPEKMDFVIAQTQQLPPVVSADVPAGGQVPESAQGVITELNPRALMLDDGGQVKSTAPTNISPEFAVVPVLTNWDEQGTIRNDLVDNLLIDHGLRQAHIDAILEAVEASAFQGIEIDYRAINPSLRSAFSEFVAELADQLHQQGKILAVRVEYPRQIAFDQWDTGAFEWPALGRVADVLKVPSLPDPQAYVPEGPMDQLARWAVSQIERQKLQFVLSTRSVDMRGTNPTFVPYTEAMAPFTQVGTESGRDTFKAGEQIVFALSAGEGSTNIMYDEGAHTYWFRYRDDRGQEHTVWLENADSIAHKLRQLAHYNLRGVAFEHLFQDGNDEQVWQVIREYHTQTVPSSMDHFAVVWTIQDSTGNTVENLANPLSDPRLAWVAPQDSGEYTVVASLSSDGGKSTTVQGETVIEVDQVQATPTPEPTKEPEPTPTPEPTKEPEPTPTPEPTQIAQAVTEATVSNNVLNLRAGPGTNYAIAGQVQRNDKLKILGKNPEGTWIKIAAPNGTEAWVILTYVTMNVSLNDVPLAEVPAAPTAAPRPAQAPAPAAPAPRGTGFGYGVQAHAFNDLSKIVNSINDLGFGWLKQQLRWEHTEGQKGKYGWDGLDRIVDACNAGGVKVMFSVVAAPSWSRGGKSGIGPPDNYQDFYDFMGALASHYKGRVHAYEIWNEQNLRREWEGAPLSASDYVRLLAGAYRAIKAVDPNAIVVSGAPTPTGINDGSWAIDDRTYLQQMYNAGLKNYCDAVGAHPSGYANPPDVYYTGGDFDPGRGYDDHPSFFFRNTMEDYYRIMAANGDGGKRIWATEFGWPTTSGMGVGPSPGYEFSENINEQQQADYIVRAYTWSRSWGHAGVMFLWNLNFWPTTGPQNEMAKYGIVRGDWSPRPAYTALKNMPK
jgi:spore germination protein YaaH